MNILPRRSPLLIRIHLRYPRAHSPGGAKARGPRRVLCESRGHTSLMPAIVLPSTRALWLSCQPSFTGNVTHRGRGPRSWGANRCEYCVSRCVCAGNSVWLFCDPLIPPFGTISNIRCDKIPCPRYPQTHRRPIWRGYRTPSGASSVASAMERVCWSGIRLRTTAQTWLPLSKHWCAYLCGDSG